MYAILACAALVLGAYHPQYFAQVGFAGNTTATDILAVDQIHPAVGAPALVEQGIDVETGVSASITSFADYSGTVAGTISATTSAAHGLVTGDIVVVLGPNVEAGDAAPYYGIHTITVIDTTSFYFTETWTETATATVMRPDYFRAPLSGSYMFSAGGTFESATANQVFEIALYVNGTLQPTYPVRATAVTANTKIIVSAGTYLLSLTKDDVVWYGVTNTTSAGDYTLTRASVMLETH